MVMHFCPLNPYFQVLTIDIKRNITIKNLRIVFVIPAYTNISLQKVNDEDAGKYFMSPPKIREDIPSEYQKFFSIEVDEFNRTTFIQKRQLEGVETYQLYWMMSMSAHEDDLKETTFGMYFRHQELQEEFYKFKIYVPKDRKPRVIKIEQTISKGKEHLPIPISFKCK